MADMISRAAACECIGKMIHEYREKGEDDLADGMIIARRYGIKRLPTIDAIPVEWLREKRVTHPTTDAEILHNSVIRAVLVMWEREQEAKEG